MIDTSEFGVFYKDYMHGEDNSRKLGRVGQLASMKLREFTMKSFEHLPVLDLNDARMRGYGTVIKEHPEFIVILIGSFTFMISNDRFIFIEIPSEERIEEIKSIPDDGLFRRAPTNRAVSWCDEFIITPHGDIVFRDEYDEFYDLLLEGKTYEAMEFALARIQDAIRRG